MSSIADKIKLACDSLCIVLKAEAPYDTGHLAINSIRVIETEPSEYHVAIGGELAPYAKYTQENWDKFQAPLKGKKNPNEGWIDRGIEKTMPLIKRIMSGAITEDEAEDYMRKQGFTKELEERQAKRASELERQAKKKAS